MRARAASSFGELACKSTVLRRRWLRGMMKRFVPALLITELAYEICIIHTANRAIDQRCCGCTGVTHDAIVHIPGVVYIFIDEETLEVNLENYSSISDL